MIYELRSGLQLGLKPTRSLSVLAYRHCGAFKRQGLDTER